MLSVPILNHFPERERLSETYEVVLNTIYKANRGLIGSITGNQLYKDLENKYDQDTITNSVLYLMEKSYLENNFRFYEGNKTLVLVSIRLTSKGIDYIEKLGVKD